MVGRQAGGWVGVWACGRVCVRRVCGRAGVWAGRWANEPENRIESVCLENRIDIENRIDFQGENRIESENLNRLLLRTESNRIESNTSLTLSD